MKEIVEMKQKQEEKTQMKDSETEKETLTRRKKRRRKRKNSQRFDWPRRGTTDRERSPKRPKWLKQKLKLQAEEKEERLKAAQVEKGHWEWRLLSRAKKTQQEEKQHQQTKRQQREENKLKRLQERKAEEGNESVEQKTRKKTEN